MALGLVALVLFIIATCHSSRHGLVLVSASPNSNPVPVPLSTVAGEFLEPHNQARAQVGVVPLKWNQSLANATSHLVKYQRIHMGCKFANLTGSKYVYGSNQEWGSGMAVTPRMAVDAWVEVKAYYNHADNSCAPDHQCASYTQVVWKKSMELGCAQAFCNKDRSTLTICFYNPPGNYVGESPY